jgi:hypothetical protein
MVTHKAKGAAPPAAGTRSPKKAPSSPTHLRPIARVQRIALFEREVRERLSRAALDLVFERAEVMSEGQRTTRQGQPVYFGSTMLTIDLEALAPQLRESCDAGTARHLAALIASDAAVAARVKGVAGREAARIVGGRLKAIATEVKVSARGARVFIDVDVEGTP